jgi:hypothetical protein
MVDPPEIGMIVPKKAMPLSSEVLNLIEVVTNCRVVVVTFPELAVVAGLIGLPVTGKTIAEMVAKMIVVVKIAKLRLDLVESS